MKTDEKSTKQNFWNRLNLGLGNDLDAFIENLGMLVAAGISINEAIDIMITEARTKVMRSLLSSIKDEVEAGSSLSKALEKTGLFQFHITALIRIGEETGTLVSSLKAIGEQQQKDHIFRSKISSAMMYPVFVLVLTVFIGVGIAWFILPKLAGVFAQLKMQLPFITKILIQSGLFLADYGNIAVPIFLVVFGLLLFFGFAFSKTKFIGQTLLFHTPGIGRLMKEMELSRFTYLLGTLLDAGLPVVHCLDSLTLSSVFPAYKSFYNYLKESIESGESFKQSFDRYKNLQKLIPISMQKMITGGEKTGTLSETLLKLNTSYESKIEITTKNLTVILEPIMLVIIWIGVVLVALAVILPIYNLVGQFKTI